MITHEECIETLKWAVERMQKLGKIEEAIVEYHVALDNRKHGGEAQNKAFDKICDVLNMHWHYSEKRKVKTYKDHTWELP